MKDGPQALQEALARKASRPIECRGRNGWFDYDHHNVLVGLGTGKPEAYVDIYSKTHGRNAPIQIQGDPAKIIALLEGIVAQLKGECKDENCDPESQEDVAG